MFIYIYMQPGISPTGAQPCMGAADKPVGAEGTPMWRPKGMARDLCEFWALLLRPHTTICLHC